MKNKYLTSKDIASMFMVTTATVREWDRKGKLTSIKTPGGHRRYSVEDVKSFAKTKNLDISFEEDANNKIKLLVVEDDEQLLLYFKSLFGMFGDKIEADYSDNGFDAGIKVKGFNPDIVLLDIMMPNIDGFDVCDKIKQDKTTKKIRVIAMTGYPTDENVNRIISLGAETCLSKPIDEDKLLEVIGVTDIL